ncbi:PAS domain S-box-containing protein [Caulobacter ginsengisoli]|uniref:histidine kinase n=1 Tax=Caulobacter ginsengisoli TaxID=400775 RepID=A0ABU0IMN5_9CAUL|nr:PAS domain S-box protein [Caulobacter ginsengisoli]MDQ0463283.1 PAS domain S-box-containing protein [Caulobacter ginsengisoli]
MTDPAKTAPEPRTTELYRQQVRAIWQAMPVAVSVTDTDGSVLWINAYWTRFTGRGEAESLGDGWRGSIHAEDLPGLDAAFLAATQTQTGFASEVRLTVAAGPEPRWVEIRGEPRLDRDGQLEGWITVANDVHERKLAMAAVQESEARFRLLAENAPVNLWMSDPEGRIVYLNRQQRAFWGAAEDLAGFKWAERVLDEDRQALYADYDLALENRAAFTVEARYWRVDGEVRTLRTEANPRFDAAGNFLGMIGVNIDTTDERRAALHQRLLTDELNHRVKNTLATVQSLAAQTLRAYSDPGEAQAMLEGRLMALSAAHNILNRENWEAADLADVVAEALHAFDTPGIDRFHTEGPSARVAPQTALAVAMVLHELCTNSMKYGALSQDGGRVSVAWGPGEGDGVLALRWAETGGPPVRPPSRRGFGSRLLAGLASELGAAAAVDYRPGGVVCALRVPLAGTAS